MKTRPVVLICPNCGKQNLIAPERLRLIDKKPIKCWVCQRVIPSEAVKRALKND